MSYITKIIVITSSLDDDKINIINEYFISINKPCLSFFDPTENCGGDKVFCDPIFLGAFNYIDHEEFIEFMVKNKSKFEYPECVQVFIKEEQSEKYEVYSLLFY